jgi:putative transposase
MHFLAGENSGLNLLDDVNREALAIEIDTSLPAERVVRILEQTFNGYPCFLT